MNGDERMYGVAAGLVGMGLDATGALALQGREFDRLVAQYLTANFFVPNVLATRAALPGGLVKP